MTLTLANQHKLVLNICRPKHKRCTPNLFHFDGLTPWNPQSRLFQSCPFSPISQKRLQNFLTFQRIRRDFIFSVLIFVSAYLFLKHCQHLSEWMKLIFLSSFFPPMVSYLICPLTGSMRSKTETTKVENG